MNEVFNDDEDDFSSAGDAEDDCSSAGDNKENIQENPGGFVRESGPTSQPSEASGGFDLHGALLFRNLEDSVICGPQYVENTVCSRNSFNLRMVKVSKLIFIMITFSPIIF